MHSFDLSAQDEAMYPHALRFRWLPAMSSTN
jgi:hypothetical protein